MSDKDEVLDMNLLEAQATREPEPEPEPEAVNEQQPEVPQIPAPKESAVDWLYCATQYLRMYDELKQFHVARGHPPAEVLKQMGIFKATCSAELRRVYNLPLYLDEKLDLNERKVWRQKLLRLYKLRILPWVCKLDYEEAEKILKGELLNKLEQVNKLADDPLASGFIVMRNLLDLVILAVSKHDHEKRLYTMLQKTAVAAWIDCLREFPDERVRIENLRRVERLQGSTDATYNDFLETLHQRLRPGQPIP
ncbi:unnamed protein product, partial [Mesorhabditis spiculigera]